MPTIVSLLAAIFPSVLSYVEQLVSDTYDEEKERQAHMAIARAVEDHRAAVKFANPPSGAV